MLTIWRIWRAITVTLVAALHRLRLFVNHRNKLISVHILLVWANQFTTSFPLMQQINADSSGTHYVWVISRFGLRQFGSGLFGPLRNELIFLQTMLALYYNFTTTFPSMPPINADNPGLHIVWVIGPFWLTILLSFFVHPRNLTISLQPTHVWYYNFTITFQLVQLINSHCCLHFVWVMALDRPTNFG